MADLIYQRIIEGFPQQLYDAIEFAIGYSKRGLVLTTPDRNDVVLLDRYDGMEWPPRELAFLHSLGLGPCPENVCAVDFDTNLSWEENIAKNREVIEQLRGRSFSRLRVFTGKSEICHLLSKELTVPIATPDVHIATWGEANQTLQELGDEFGLSPRGYTVESNDDIMKRWHDLEKLPEFSGLAVLKAAQAASGVISTVVSNADELARFLAQFDYSTLDGGVLQEWLESDPRSPSVNYDVSPDEEVCEAFISDQIFEDSALVYGQEGTRIHRGNIYPTSFDGSIVREIREKTRIYLDELVKNGHCGPIGFDTIVLTGNVPKYYGNARVLITEINPRKTGPRYGHFPMMLLGAGAFRLRNEHVDKGLSMNDITKRLSGIFFDKITKEGFVPFNVFPGKFTGITLAGSKERLEEVCKKVDQKLQEL